MKSPICANTKYRRVKGLPPVEIGCGRPARYIWSFWIIGRFGKPIHYARAVCGCGRLSEADQRRLEDTMEKETGHRPSLIPIVPGAKS